MERRDALVASVGGAIVALAVVAAALGGPSSTAFAVAFPTEERTVGEGSRAHTAEDVRDTFTFSLAEANATRLVVNVEVSFLAGPGAIAAMDVRLTAPDGTSHEAAGQTQGPAPGGTRAVARAVVEVPLAALPANVTVDAQTPEEAAARASPPFDSPWLGEWTLDVAARAGPTPLAQATTTWSATATVWRAAATPPVGASR